MTVPEDREIIEMLAAIEHKRWSDWHQHAYDNWTPININRWNEQARTSYTNLPEPVKELDRREVYRYWPIIKNLISETRRQERMKVLNDMSHRVHQILGGYPEFTHDDLIKIKSLIRDELDKLKQEGR